MQRLAVSTKNQQSTELKSDGMFSVTLNRCWFSVNFFALIFLELIYYLLTFRHGRKKRNSVLIYFTPDDMDLQIWHINWLHILWWWNWCEGECWQCQVMWVCYIDRLHICPMSCQEMLNLWNGLSGTSAVVDWKKHNASNVI